MVLRYLERSSGKIGSPPGGSKIVLDLKHRVRTGCDVQQSKPQALKVVQVPRQDGVPRIAASHILYSIHFQFDAFSEVLSFQHALCEQEDADPRTSCLSAARLREISCLHSLNTWQIPMLNPKLSFHRGFMPFRHGGRVGDGQVRHSTEESSVALFPRSSSCSPTTTCSRWASLFEYCLCFKGYIGGLSAGEIRGFHTLGLQSPAKVINAGRPIPNSSSKGFCAGFP